MRPITLNTPRSVVRDDLVEQHLADAARWYEVDVYFDYTDRAQYLEDEEAEARAMYARINNE
jgi:hypothetical protein